MVHLFDYSRFFSGILSLELVFLGIGFAIWHDNNTETVMIFVGCGVCFILFVVLSCFKGKVDKNRKPILEETKRIFRLFQMQLGTRFVKILKGSSASGLDGGYVSWIAGFVVKFEQDEYTICRSMTLKNGKTMWNMIFNDSIWLFQQCYRSKFPTGDDGCVCTY